MDSGNFERANKLLLQTIELDSTQSRAFGLLGWCYQESANVSWLAG